MTLRWSEESLMSIHFFFLRIQYFIIVSSLFLYSHLIYKYIQIAQFENGIFAYETVLGL